MFVSVEITSFVGILVLKAEKNWNWKIRSNRRTAWCDVKGMEKGDERGKKFN
jgi:hypothetical protein